MNKCPQCQSVFPDDYMFCMNDGTTLIREDGEQDTVVRDQIKMSGETSTLPPDMVSACPSCNFANRADSKFCKKCGTAMQTPDSAPVHISLQQTEHQSTPMDSQTMYIPPPPTSTQTANVAGPAANNQFLLIGGLIGGVLLTILIIFAVNSMNSSSETARSSNSSNRNSSSDSAVNTDPNVQTEDNSNSNANEEEVRSDEELADVADHRNEEYSEQGGPDSNANVILVPKNQRVMISTTDIVARDSASPNASQVAVFFRNTKLQVLDSARSETGTIWYRVKVIEYGCSPKVNRCGKDDFYDSDVGWVYSNNVYSP